MSTDSVPPADQWTVRRVLEWTIAHLKKHGSESARLDAEVLLAHARGCSRIQLYTAYDEILSEPVRQKMRDLVKRRANAEPVAYLVGTKEFYSLPFEVNSHVLIPRPDTELLVMEGLRLIKSIESPHILEIGIGSGCISTALAVNHKEARITGIEIDPETLAVARRNIERHHVSERVDLRLGDLFSPLKSDERFQLIVSNPPYIPSREIAELDPTVQRHEPHRALDGGPDGLDILKKIVADAPSHLVSGGWLLMEFSPEQAEPMRAIMSSHGYSEITVLNDLGQSARAICGRWAKSE